MYPPSLNSNFNQINSNFTQELQNLTQGGRLIIEDNQIKRVSFLTALFEDIKGMLGFESKTTHLKEKISNYILNHSDEIHDAETIKLILKLASKAGLMTPNSMQDPSSEINEIMKIAVANADNATIESLENKSVYKLPTPPEHELPFHLTVPATTKIFEQQVVRQEKKGKNQDQDAAEANTKNDNAAADQGETASTSEEDRKNPQQEPLLNQTFASKETASENLPIPEAPAPIDVSHLNIPAAKESQESKTKKNDAVEVEKKPESQKTEIQQIDLETNKGSWSGAKKIAGTAISVIAGLGAAYFLHNQWSSGSPVTPPENELIPQFTPPPFPSSLADNPTAQFYTDLSYFQGPPYHINSTWSTTPEATKPLEDRIILAPEATKKDTPPPELIETTSNDYGFNNLPQFPTPQTLPKAPPQAIFEDLKELDDLKDVIANDVSVANHSNMPVPPKGKAALPTPELQNDPENAFTEPFNEIPNKTPPANDYPNNSLPTSPLTKALESEQQDFSSPRSSNPIEMTHKVSFSTPEKTNSFATPLLTGLGLVVVTVGGLLGLKQLADNNPENAGNLADDNGPNPYADSRTKNADPKTKKSTSKQQGGPAKLDAKAAEEAKAAAIKANEEAAKIKAAEEAAAVEKQNIANTINSFPSLRQISEVFHDKVNNYYLTEKLKLNPSKLDKEDQKLGLLVHCLSNYEAVGNKEFSRQFFQTLLDKYELKDNFDTSKAKEYAEHLQKLEKIVDKPSIDSKKDIISNLWMLGSNFKILKGLSVFYGKSPTGPITQLIEAHGKLSEEKYLERENLAFSLKGQAREFGTSKDKIIESTRNLLKLEDEPTLDRLPSEEIKFVLNQNETTPISAVRIGFACIGHNTPNCKEIVERTLTLFNSRFEDILPSFKDENTTILPNEHLRKVCEALLQEQLDFIKECQKHEGLYDKDFYQKATDDFAENFKNVYNLPIKVHEKHGPDIYNNVPDLKKMEKEWVNFWAKRAVQISSDLPQLTSKNNLTKFFELKLNDLIEEFRNNRTIETDENLISTFSASLAYRGIGAAADDAKLIIKILKKIIKRQPNLLSDSDFSFISQANGQAMLHKIFKILHEAAFFQPLAGKELLKSCYHRSLSIYPVLAQEIAILCIRKHDEVRTNSRGNSFVSNKGDKTSREIVLSAFPDLIKKAPLLAFQFVKECLIEYAKHAQTSKATFVGNTKNPTLLPAFALAIEKIQSTLNKKAESDHHLKKIVEELTEAAKNFEKAENFDCDTAVALYTAKSTEQIDALLKTKDKEANAAEFKVAGEKITNLLKELTIPIGKNHYIIPAGHYFSFLEENPLQSSDAKEAYKTVVILESRLKKLKESSYDAEAGMIHYETTHSVPSSIAINDLNHILKTLSLHKNKLLQICLSSNVDASKIIDNIGIIVGTHIDIPTDFKFAILEFIDRKGVKEITSYLALAAWTRITPKTKADALNDASENLLSLIDKHEWQEDLSFSQLSTSKLSVKIKEYHEYLFDQKFAEHFTLFEKWLASRVGAYADIKILTKNLVPNKALRSAASKEKSLKTNTKLEEFLDYPEYGIQLKNTWKTTKKNIGWEITINEKQVDGKWKRKTAKNSVSTNLKLGPQQIQFLRSYLESGKKITGKTLQNISYQPLIQLGKAISDQLETDIKKIFVNETDISFLQNLSKDIIILKDVRIPDDLDEEDMSASRFDLSRSQFSQDTDDLSRSQFFQDTDDLSRSQFFQDTDDLSRSQFFQDTDDLPVSERPQKFGSNTQMQPLELDAKQTPSKALNPKQPSSGYAQALAEKAYKQLDWVNKKFEHAQDNITKNIKSAPYIFNKTTALGKKVDNLLKYTEKSQKEEDPAPYSTYTNFLSALRDILNSSEYKLELAKKINKQPYLDEVDLILDLCQNQFEKGFHYNFHNDLLSMLGLSDDGKGFSKDDFLIEKSDTFQNNKLPSIEVNLKKLSGHLNFGFDPHLQGNIPYVFGTIKIAGKERKLLRIGSPTIEGWYGRAEINPEFRGYIQHCALNNKRHLYVSLQNDKVKHFWQGDESGRNAAIKNLQTEFPNNFFAVVLAQDSYFYKQVDSTTGLALGNQTADSFLQDFEGQLYGINTGYYLPDKWKVDPVFRKNVSELLSLVHTTCFAGKTDLTRQEKQDFIEIAYTFLVPYFTYYCDADNLNTSCKDAIDRAGKLNALIILLYSMVTKTNDDTEYKRFQQVAALTPAILTKGQLPIGSHGSDATNGRRERLISADKAMKNATDILRGLHIPIWTEAPQKLEDSIGVRFEENKFSLIDPTFPMDFKGPDFDKQKMQTVEEEPATPTKALRRERIEKSDKSKLASDKQIEVPAPKKLPEGKEEMTKDNKDFLQLGF